MPRATENDRAALRMIRVFGVICSITGLVLLTFFYFPNLQKPIVLNVEPNGQGAVNFMFFDFGWTFLSMGIIALFAVWQACRYYSGKSSIITMKIPPVPYFFFFVGILMALSGLTHLRQLDFQLLPISASKITAAAMIPFGLWLACIRIIAEIRYRRELYRQQSQRFSPFHH